jgi:hypothetical protein
MNSSSFGMMLIILNVHFVWSLEFDGVTLDPLYWHFAYQYVCRIIKGYTPPALAFKPSASRREGSALLSKRVFWRAKLKKNAIFLGFGGFA